MLTLNYIVRSPPLAGYVDIHNHILPGLDDGPRTINEAIMLAKAMVAVGYDTVIATPHTFEGKPTPALISERLQELQHELNRHSVPLTLLPGFRTAHRRVFTYFVNTLQHMLIKPK